MHRLRTFFGRRTLLGGLLLLATAVGLQGCFRGPWHGHYDPARFDERLDEVQQDIADELELRPDQRPAFDALMAKHRDVIRAWRDGWHQTALDVKQALEQQPADADAVGAAIKQRIRERPSEAQIEQLIDDTVAFYRTLDADQQEHVRKHLLRHLQRRVG